MLAPITIRYPFQPVRRSLAAAQVADLFGLSAEEPPHTIAENLTLDIRPGQVVLFTGPSGSGKSSLLRAAAKQLGAADPFEPPLPEVPLVEALPGPIESRLAMLSSCGLSEARLLLRTPAELSDGQRYRFRLAMGMTMGAPFVACDEFAAMLDRPLAKVLAFNLRKQSERSGVGVLAATTHEDVAADLAPHRHVLCFDDGRIEVIQPAPPERHISFFRDLVLSEGTLDDWHYFSQWHYRSHQLAFVQRVVLLWHERKRIGICVFAAPAASLKLRTAYFGLKNPRSPLALKAMNEQLWLLQRVVLHPSYRGAGIAAAFVRQACRTCPVDWIETLSAMGQTNPLFERAGFRRVGAIPRTGSASGAYARPARLSAETEAKSRYSEPIYYVFDNRGRNSRATFDGWPPRTATSLRG